MHKIRSYESRLPPGRDLDSSSDEYLLDECPCCGKEFHFYWNKKKNVGYCQSCGDSVFGIKNLEKLSNSDAWITKITTQLGNKSSTDQLINKIRRGYRVSAWDYDETRHYLKGVRGLDQAIIDAVPIQYLPEVQAMIAPIDALSDEFPEEIIYRRLHGWPSKWVGLPGVKVGNYAFGIRHLPARCKKLLFCEGLFDIVCPRLLGMAVGCLGTSIGDIWGAWARKRGVEEAWLWFDPDPAGQKGVAKLHKSLTMRGIQVNVVDCPLDPKEVSHDKRIIKDLKELLQHNE